MDLNYYKPLGQTEEMAEIDRRTIKACTSMGIMMTDTCVNYQTIMPQSMENTLRMVILVLLFIPTVYVEQDLILREVLSFSCGFNWKNT